MKVWESFAVFVFIAFLFFVVEVWEFVAADDCGEVRCFFLCDHFFGEFEEFGAIGSGDVFAMFFNELGADSFAASAEENIGLCDIEVVFTDLFCEAAVRLMSCEGCRCCAGDLVI